MSFKKCFIIGGIFSLIIGIILGILIAKSINLCNGIIMGFYYSVSGFAFWGGIIFLISGKKYKEKSRKYQLPEAINALIIIYSITLFVESAFFKTGWPLAIKLALLIIGLSGIVVSIYLVWLDNKTSNETTNNNTNTKKP